MITPVEAFDLMDDEVDAARRQCSACGAAFRRKRVALEWCLKSAGIHSMRHDQPLLQ
jgi:predicted nucleic acid-binding Zn ribbon protein